MPGFKRSKDGMQGGGGKRVKMTVRKPTVKQVVEKILRRKTELKEVTNYYTGTLATAGAVLGAINIPSEGSDYNNRIGRHIMGKQIQADIYASVAAGAANALSADNVMFALIYDRDPENAVPSFGTIFDTSGSITAGLAFKNTFTDSDRFRIVWIEQAAINSNGPSSFHKRHFFSIPEFMSKSEFSNTTTAIQSGAYYVALACTTVGGTAVSYQVNLKYQFTDM